MMPRYPILNDSNVVINVLMCEPDYEPGDGLSLGEIADPPGQKGDTWNGSAYVSPNPVTPPTVEELKTDYAAAVDVQAERIRLKYITRGDGMVMTYREKLEQAEQAVAQGQSAIDALSTEEEKAAYPTLSASVGIEADTLWECANLVLSTYQQWANISYEIEKIRLSAKKAINEAVTVEDVHAAYDAIDWGAL